MAGCPVAKAKVAGLKPLFRSKSLEALPRKIGSAFTFDGGEESKDLHLRTKGAAFES
jgi:hypothetical protein